MRPKSENRVGMQVDEFGVMETGQTFVQVGMLIVGSRVGKPVFPPETEEESVVWAYSQPADASNCDNSSIAQSTATLSSRIDCLWRNSIPVFIEVLLRCSCEPGAHGRLPQLCLVELWSLHMLSRRSADERASIHTLIRAIQDYLTTSALARWTRTHGCQVLYRVCAPGENGSSQFESCARTRSQSFPVSRLGSGAGIKVSVDWLSLGDDAWQPTFTPQLPPSTVANGDHSGVTNNANSTATENGRHAKPDGRRSLNSPPPPPQPISPGAQSTTSQQLQANETSPPLSEARVVRPKVIPHPTRCESPSRSGLNLSLPRTHVPEPPLKSPMVIYTSSTTDPSTRFVRTDGPAECQPGVSESTHRQTSASAFDWDGGCESDGELCSGGAYANAHHHHRQHHHDRRSGNAQSSAGASENTLNLPRDSFLHYLSPEGLVPTSELDQLLVDMAKIPPAELERCINDFRLRRHATASERPSSSSAASDSGSITPTGRVEWMVGDSAVRSGPDPPQEPTAAAAVGGGGGGTLPSSQQAQTPPRDICRQSSAEVSVGSPGSAVAAAAAADDQLPSGSFVRSPTDGVIRPRFVRSKSTGHALSRRALSYSEPSEHDSRGRQIPSASAKSSYHRSTARSSSVLFHTTSGLPLQSSPAPAKRASSSSFDYDYCLDSVKAIKDALSDVSLTGKISSSAPAASTTTSSLLGNFEESLLNGRIEPVGLVEGFSAEIGASGAFCPRHISLPVTAYFFRLSDDNAPSPYLGHINIEAHHRRGYHVPKRGTIQVTLFNPNRTVVKMFVVAFDLTDMPPNCQTFLRQRTVYMPVAHSQTPPSGDSKAAAQSYLRYLIHLRLASSKSGKIYLHTDIRLIFARDKFEFDPRVATYELRSFTEAPRNPRFSPKK